MTLTESGVRGDSSQDPELLTSADCARWKFCYAKVRKNPCFGN